MRKRDKRLLKPEEIEKTMMELGNLYTHDLKSEDMLYRSIVLWKNRGKIIVELS